jgi:hypothetical protein
LTTREAPLFTSTAAVVCGFGNAERAEVVRELEEVAETTTSSSSSAFRFALGSSWTAAGGEAAPAFRFAEGADDMRPVVGGKEA